MADIQVSLPYLANITTADILDAGGNFAYHVDGHTWTDTMTNIFSLQSLEHALCSDQKLDHFHLLGLTIVTKLELWKHDIMLVLNWITYLLNKIILILKTIYFGFSNRQNLLLDIMRKHSKSGYFALMSCRHLHHSTYIMTSLFAQTNL